VAGIIIPENSISPPDIPPGLHKEGGILTIADSGRLTLPKDSGGLYTPPGYEEKGKVKIPEDAEVLEYADCREAQERSPMSSGEMARAFGNFAAYFESKLKDYFPSHRELPDQPLRKDYERVYEEKTYFNRVSGLKETLKVSKPGSVEEECIVALRIAGEPNFRGTLVAEEALKKAKILLEKGRIAHGEPYLPKLPEMPTLLAEAEQCLRRFHTQGESRKAIYQLINQTRIPPSEISDLGLLMEDNGDLKHPLAYRLLIEASSDSEWYKKQEEKRENILELLSGDPNKMIEMYPHLRDLAKGLVCSMNVKNPLRGKVGVEIEFGGLEITDSLGKPPRFDFYQDPDGNEEVSRSFEFIELDARYLSDLEKLATFLRDGATHISSLHLHLDRDRHPVSPEMGSLLGNMEDLTILQGRLKNTWEVRGMVSPSRGKELDSACVADIIQLCIVASTEYLNPEGTIQLPEETAPTVEQIIFAHICRFVSSPEGRLAALKILEHPLALRAVNPETLLRNFTREDQARVYPVLKSGLFGKYAENKLNYIGNRYRLEAPIVYEELSEEEVTTQYEGSVGILTETGVLQKLESGKLGIVGIDGKEYPLPTIENILAEFREKAETLGPKMKQGFRELLIVPFGMKLENLIQKYSQALTAHYDRGELFGTVYPNKVLHLSETPVYYANEASIVYYPREYPYIPKNGGNSGGRTKKEILTNTKSGWSIMLAEDLPKIPQSDTGKLIGDRIQLEANKSPEQYLEILETDPMYHNEIGMTPEDWLIYALMHLEKTNQVVDDQVNSYLLGASSIGTLWVYWSLGDTQHARLSVCTPWINYSYKGARTTVRVN
jgi:hypothetical protein